MMNNSSPTFMNLNQIQPFGNIKTIEVSDTASILTPGRGFIKSYDFTLNPYVGCSFGCVYCYVPTLKFRGPHRQENGNWGEYVKLKENAVDVTRRKAPELNGKTLYMSPVIDPYQAVEKKAGITRGVLEALDGSGVRLTVQTRATLVTRDIDLLKNLNARVNITITTDDPDVRVMYERFCPSTEARLKATGQLAEAGITVAATCCPLLPLRNPVEFADRLKDVGVSFVVIQYVHTTKVGATTPSQTLLDIQQHGWSEEEYRRVYDILVERLAPLPVYEGSEGFQPVLPHFAK